MCSYSSVNGVPSCASPYLETELMRGEWGLGNGSVGGSYIVSDCGAVNNIVAKHFAANTSQATALALNAGTDIVCNEFGMGNAYFTSVAAALSENITSEAVIDASLVRSTTLQFRAGLFEREPLSGPFGNITLDVVGSEAHAQLALDAGRQSLVLLKNRGDTLPLPQGRHVAVIGPTVNSSTALTGSYFEAIGPVPTLAAAVGAVNLGGSTSMVLGLPTVTSTSTSGFTDVIAAVQAADYVVLALGIDGTVCGEGKDRESIDLPSGQAALLNTTLLAAGSKPVVVVLTNGGQLSVPLAEERASAIIEAFFPGQSGGTPIAEAIFGGSGHPSLPLANS